MKTSKQVHVPTRDVRYLDTVDGLRPRNFEATCKGGSVNVGCQCNILQPLCTCRKPASREQRYFTCHKQVYRYSDWRDFTDIGVSSIKVLPRKKVWKIYLPETIDQAVGSADFTSGIKRRSKQKGAVIHQENRKTYSKCVGVLANKELSPISQKKSGTTSPISRILGDQDIKISNLQQPKSLISVQISVHELNTKLKAKENSEISKVKSDEPSKHTLQGEIKKHVLPTATEQFKSVVTYDNAETCKVNSSDSFVQHVHNLENPSDYKQSKLFANIQADNLATEYRKIFTSKEIHHVEKPMSDSKGTFLRKRFEALRRGMGKKESNKESIITDKTASQTGVPSFKDVSIASDPPSLESRSYSNTKVYSPNLSTRNYYKPLENISHKRSPQERSKDKKNKDCTRRSLELRDDTNNYESVQGMFKLWGKKFNLDEDVHKTSPSDVTRSPDELSKTESPTQADFLKKKQGRKFFIFGKKTTDKDSKSYKSKKGITTGRCEVKDGLSIKVEGNECHVTESDKKQDTNLEKHDNILHNPWLHKYISNRNDSRNSVHIRWNNKMYTTSSSTVLELMDNVYKQTGIDFRSRSEIGTGKSSNYNVYSKQRQNFIQKDIEAWMLPKMITNMHQRQSIDHKAYHDSSTCQRWFVDASKGFSQKIELVLHSKVNRRNSEYVIINIPEGYFSHSSSEQRAQSSDEKIYNVVEYDTPELKWVKETRHMATGDYFINDSNLNENEKPNDTSTMSDSDSEDKEVVTLFRDVAIQGSDVIVRKRCDVIGVGIINQRDIRDGNRSMLKIEDELSGSESVASICRKKCDLADSYLQKYCRNWMPSGTDTLTWRLSDSQHTERNSLGSLSQGDGTKSRANVYENLQEPTQVFSSCSHCIALNDDKKLDGMLPMKLLNKIKRKCTEMLFSSDKRNYPKDSIEVHKRRQYYARKNIKSQWYMNKKESNSFLNTKKQPKKRVSLPDFDDTGKLVDRPPDKSPPLENTKRLVEEILDDSPPPSPPVSVDTIKEPPCSLCFKGPRKTSSENLQQPSNHLIAKKTSQESNLSLDMSPTPSSNLADTSFPTYSKNPKKTKESKPTCTSKNEDFKKFVNTPPTPPPTAYHMPQTLDTTDHCKDTKEFQTKCARKRENFNKLLNTPPPHPHTACNKSQTPDLTNNNKGKVSGLHAKKIPSPKKSISSSCHDSGDPCVIRLNSREEFTIRVKKDTPSTEEIRESLNIKVQDEDGQTLYERIDYKQSGEVNDPVIKYGNKYSQVQRLSTPIAVQDVIEQRESQIEIVDVKSESSIDNLIEINFTLKLKQGDKATEITLKNDADSEIKQKSDRKVAESNSVIIQNTTVQGVQKRSSKKDINIKIVVKNYNTDPEQTNENEIFTVPNNTQSDVFTKRISEKFQTVATGYSDIDQNVFSVQRAAVDLSTSVDEYRVDRQLSQYTASDEIVTLPYKLVTSRHRVKECPVTDQIVHSIYNDKEESAASTKKSYTDYDWNSKILSQGEADDFNENKSNQNTINQSQKHIVNAADETSNESVLFKNIRLHKRAEKKAMLKKLFRSGVVQKPENKKKIKDLLHAILTSDSSGTETVLTGIELTKKRTNPYLEPSYFRNTDSINSYNHFESKHICGENYRQEILNPTRNNSELDENDSDVSPTDDKKQGCMCSMLANKLNITLNGGSNKCGCCCQGNCKKDEEINNVNKVGTDNFLFNVKPFIDVETQISKHVFNKRNNTKLAKRSKMPSVVITKTSFTVQNSIHENIAARQKSSKTYLSSLSDVKYIGTKTFNKETVVGLSQENILLFKSNIVKKSVSKCKKQKIYRNVNSKEADFNILQLNETKRAVLEIYKDKITSDKGEILLAKLPKFNIEKETITNYEGAFPGSKKLRKRNYVMMAVNR